MPASHQAGSCLGGWLSTGAGKAEPCTPSAAGETIDAVLSPVVTRATFKKVRAGSCTCGRVCARGVHGGRTHVVLFRAPALAVWTPPPRAAACCSQGRSLYVKLGDKDVEYNRGFRLFLHTKLSNPHYPPEIQVETTMVNFTVTEVGSF